MDDVDIDVSVTDEEDIIEFLDNNPKYVDALKRCISVQMELESEWSSEHRGFEWHQVQVQPARLTKMVEEGLLKVTFNSNSTTEYRVKNPDLCTEMIDKVESDGNAVFLTEPEIPDDIFEVIIGYEDVKERMKRALKSRSVRQSILLVGPRASAKTIFLEEIARIPGTLRMTGRSMTPAGMENNLLRMPRYIIIDEFGRMPVECFDILLPYQDPKQPFSVTKVGKDATISIEEKAPVFGSMNPTERVPEENRDRFWRFSFDRYEEEEFRTISRRLLSREFGLDEDLGEYIAEKLMEIEGRDVSIRDVERIGEVVECREDVDREIDVLDKYTS